MPAKHGILGEACLIRPYCSKTPYQGGNPVSRLDSLIPMAFEVEQRLNKAPPPLTAPVHASRDLGNQRWAQGVLVEYKNKVIW